MTGPAAWRQHPLAAALHEALGRHRDAVLQAPTGAGKSTLVPLALLEALPGADQKILMLEPRRLAARAVAARMAMLLGEPVGASVGYRMRLDTRVSAATRIEVLTEGVLTRMLQEDPGLERVAWLIFDEYHERSLQADLGLALALDARRELEGRFRVLVMSATLEAERVAALLEDAAVIGVPGRAFAVDIRYLGHGLPALPPPAGAAAPARGAPGDSPGRAAARATAHAVQQALDETAGDVLVFLAGVGEIGRVQQQLAELGLPTRVQVLPLYGELAGEAQDAVLSPPPASIRRVVLATNIAETSVTIPRVTAVVDSGLARRPRFDPVTGMSRLELVRISRAASEQRAGRAGRTAPGVCYRLWSEGAQAQLAATTPPEILEADLAPLALELARWGTADAARLRWLDAPPAAPLAQARELLARLGALDPQGRLTALGVQMARLPVHPRLAHMLVSARALGAVTLAAQLAALLSERDLLRGGEAGAADRIDGREGERGTRAVAPRDPDIRARLELLQRRVATPAVERVRQVARQLERTALQLPSGDSRAPGAAQFARLPEPDRPGALLALGFPDRIGQRREGSAGRYLLANGRGAAFATQGSLARGALIVAIELDDREREARIDLAAPLSAAALESLLGDHILSEEHHGWDERAGALLSRRVRRLGALLLEERLLPAPDDARAVPAMLEVLQKLGLDALPWDEQARTLQARMQFVRLLQRRELADWPASDDASLLAALPQWLAPYLGTITRRAALARLPLHAALLARLTGAQQRLLESLAPRELAVPSGAIVRVNYLGDNAPSLAVRLQEMFGLADTPRIGGGAVPVTLELLSPARRPVQITRDLAGFWRSSYAEVRRELRGRYPRHDWPEDPRHAAPSRGAKRRPRS